MQVLTEAASTVPPSQQVALWDVAILMHGHGIDLEADKKTQMFLRAAIQVLSVLIFS